MKATTAIAAAAAALSAFAETWYPAPGWKETPDRSASPFALRGGEIRFNGSQYPKSFNGYVDNNTYTMMTFELMYEPLLSIDDETSDFEPLLARRWAVSDDKKSFTFELDPRAKWSDGASISAEDVLWTYDTLINPSSQAGPYMSILSDFERPEISGEEFTDPATGAKFHRTVTFRYNPVNPATGERDGSAPPSWRALLNCGTFAILPKHAFEGKKFVEIDMVDAVVSGPYRLSKTITQIRSEFTRRGDWWREGTPGTANLVNFDKIIILYYRDNESAFEAFNDGQLDVYAVYSAHIMANQTFGTPFRKNWILKRRVENRHPSGFQGFAMNLRKDIFKDVRVRRALAMLLDRETMNRTLMYDSYFLHKSYYEQYYDAAHPCTNPVCSYNPDAAKRLLAEAGWKRNPETQILEKDFGNGPVPFRFTFLSRNKTDVKFLAPYSARLREAGIVMEVNQKDFAGWMRDMDEHFFDMTWASWGGSLFPNPGPMWESSEADVQSSNNITGFRNAELDALVNEERGEFDRAKREDLMRRIDAILARECPYILLWNISATRILYWNKFGTPDNVLGKYGNETSIFTYWWIDPDRKADLEKAVEGGTLLPAVPFNAVYSEGPAPEAAAKTEPENAK